MSRTANIERYAGEQLTKLQYKLHDALETGDVEAVHQVRVTSRRLEEPLTLCRAWMKDKEIDRITKRLKRLRRAFTEIRELDVFQMSLADFNPEEFGPQGPGMLLEKLGSKRTAALRAAQKRCSRFEPQKLAIDVQAVLEEALQVAGDCEERIERRLREMMAERAGAVLDSTGMDPASGDLHLIRIGLKKLRYSVELQVEVEDDPDKSLIDQFKQIQDLLGDWNDHLQAAQRLARLARKRNALIERPEWSAALFGHAAQRVRRAQELASEFLKRWPDFKPVLAGLAGK